MIRPSYVSAIPLSLFPSDSAPPPVEVFASAISLSQAGAGPSRGDSTRSEILARLRPAGPRSVGDSKKAYIRRASRSSLPCITRMNSPHMQ